MNIKINLRDFRLKLLFFILCLFSGCSDYLDKKPDDMLTLEMIFDDKIRTEDWLAGIYTKVQDPIWDGCYIYGALGDDMAPSVGWEKFGWTIIQKQTGNWSPNSPAPDYWTDLPKRIRSALIFIEKVKPNLAQKVTEEDVENMKNEARFLIAYYYWLLIELYGPVPMNTDQILSPASSIEELVKPQTPYDTLVDWIDQELVRLSGVLPATYADKKKFGRATSIVCLAVRARMLMFAASPLVNGNPDYIGHKNVDGEELFNSNFDKNKWTRATVACKELIDAAHAVGHKLYYEYNDDGTIDPFLSYQNMMFKKISEGNAEILFARPATSYSSYDKHCTPRGCAGNGGYGVTQSLVDAFFMENGLSPIIGYNQDGSPIINEASGYKEKGFSDAPEVRKTKWIECQGDDKYKKNGQVTLAETYNMYCHREPRFYISVLYNRAWYRSEDRTTRFMMKEWDGGPTHDAPQNGYLMRKSVHPDHDSRNNIYPYRPGILYRLGEAYLNYAEALNESDPAHPDIMIYLNHIRERAGIPTYGSNPDQIPSPVGQSAVREAIRKERRVELNCEYSLRYNDIRRWKIGEEVLDRPFYGMNYLGSKLSDDDNNADAYFKRTVYQNRKYSKKCYWYPVPQWEMDKNDKLVQNPFWK